MTTMKPFWVWLIVTLIVLGSVGGAYHAYLVNNPRRILVVLDSSFPMQSAWPHVPNELQSLSRRRYAQFSLVTEKRRVHGWSPRLEMGPVSPFAPRDFAKLDSHGRYQEIEEATEIHFLTNAAVRPIGSFDGWTIHRLK